MGWSTKAFALTAVVILLAALFFVLQSDEDKKRSSYVPTISVVEHIIVAEIPETEEQRIITVGISNLAVKGTPEDPEYNPLFFVDDTGLDDHQIRTLEMLELASDVPVYVFNHSSGLAGNIESQLGGSLGLDNVTSFEYTGDSLLNFKGFHSFLTAETYEEALWIAPLSRITSQIIVPGDQTYMTQEDVWDSLWGHGLDADYVVVVDPEDWKDMYTEFDGQNVSYHIKHLALTAAELAMYRMGYVITRPEVLTSIPADYTNLAPPDDMDLNLWPMGMLNALRNVSEEYGPINNIALVGSAEAVPQFECPDYSESEPDYTSSDSIYGFLDRDEKGMGPGDSNMDAGVGRIVNYNVQGASNQLVRTFLYDDLADTVTVQYENGETVTTNWRSHGVDANGFEVADMRGQNTPGLFAVRDYDDESYTFDYISTIGVGLHGQPTLLEADFDVASYVQGAGHLLYRGHGSWHGTLYTWGYYGPGGIYGNRTIEGDAARELFVPPQVTLLFSCENTKIHGFNYGGSPIEMDRLFATSWMYAGAVALIGATEVSYSNVGQDVTGLAGEVTGDHNWDLNNLWFASTAKYTLDEEYPMGEVMRLSENRYLDKHPGVDPFTIPSGDNGAHWKEIVMYALIGDPAFEYHVTSEGENDYMPWD